jgi:hypothetical protein
MLMLTEKIESSGCRDDVVAAGRCEDAKVVLDVACYLLLGGR